MTKISTIVSFDSLLKDLHPRPSDRIKQWVIDERTRREWIAKTCPRIDVAEHRDNTDYDCRNMTCPLWYDALKHDCCSVCTDAAEATRDRADIAAWCSEYEQQPKICEDRMQLSDEIAPNLCAITNHPFYETIRSKR